MKKYLIYICFFIAMAMQAHADSKILVVRGQDFEPYHFVGPTGEDVGFIVEIIRSVAANINVEVEFKQYSWSRCLHMVKTGRADAMMNLFKTDQRMEFMFFSENILTYEINRFFKLKNERLDFSDDMSDLATLKVGAIRNYSYGQKFDSMIFPRIYRLETEEALVKSLVNKRCDVIVGNEIVLQRLINRMGIDDDVESLPTLVSNDPLYLGFSKAKGHEKLSARFSKTLAEFKKTKQYTDILNKYGLQP